MHALCGVGSRCAVQMDANTVRLRAYHLIRRDILHSTQPARRAPAANLPGKSSADQRQALTRFTAPFDHEPGSGS